MKKLIDKISATGKFTADEIISVLRDGTPETDEYLFSVADNVRRRNYGDEVYIRGLVEISNYCKNNCLYCGIRAGNKNVERYRLSEEDILSCCDEGYRLGFRTFVLQGGEDNHFTDEVVCAILKKIKGKYPDCAVTLSLGERTRESYQRLYDAGADRYLLRHETADAVHYGKLHPDTMRYDERMRCLSDLKEIGYQVGAGFMVGSPFQTYENLAKDLLFLAEFRPHMVGIGPFIPHCDTPFGKEKRGALRDTLVMVALTRLILPNALIPSTTALGSIHPEGREMGLKAGANVVMPNLSPGDVRKLYALYENKASSGSEAAEGLEILRRQVENAGYRIVVSRGDFKG
ncbi:MAG: [FeFe] hydrogenase H-cluster radical SAM maturase HydE [Ruminococcus sp.]|nr:[FeFe] hydrogenase H-cluster radical SAM maturase HydE [Ruminococcus sp.]